ncbi:MAG: arsenate reductase ArsC [Hyphomicrobiales bacterium]
MAGDLPGAVLFACGQNAIRSPMAEGLARHFYGHRIYVASCGVRAGEPDPFVTEVMDELGIGLERHRPKSFEDLSDDSFDLIVSLSPEAHHWAVEMTRTMALEAEYWPTIDPSLTEGSRDQRLDAYRYVRDQLRQRLLARFGSLGAGGV